MSYNNYGMIELAVLLFLIVLMVSGFIYLFCKRVIYKLNRRVLARNMALIKNGRYLQKVESLSEAEIREKLIYPFFMVLGYNTYDMREFQSFVGRNGSMPDYLVKKWDHSKFCKTALAIKYIDFSEDDVDFDAKICKDKAGNPLNINEMSDKVYFKSEYYILTNGYLYLFYNRRDKKCKDNFIFSFNVKNYSKADASELAHYTKQCLFLEISDVYRV